LYLNLSQRFHRMSKYTGFERLIARNLSRFPKIKILIKELYSRLVFLTNKKKYKVSSAYPIKQVLSGDQESFFGYYDKSPVNEFGFSLVCSYSGSSSLAPCSSDSISLKVLNNLDEELVSRNVISFNWQQGCRAHWLTGDLFIYNDFSRDKSRYISRVFSISKNKEIKSFDLPVQDSFGTSYFLSINYRRLLSLRPDYGYRNLEGLSDIEISNLQDDGVWKVDYESGRCSLLISLQDACAVDSKPAMEGAHHKFNHVMISPLGDKFIFMHRYLLDGRRFDRLFLACSDTGKLRLLSDSGMVSHCFWLNND